MEKSSVNDQLIGHFQSLFIYYLFIYFRTPDPKSEKNSRKSTNKKFWPYFTAKMCIFPRQEEVGGIGRIKTPCNHSKQRYQHLKALLIYFMQFWGP